MTAVMAREQVCALLQRIVPDVCLGYQWLWISRSMPIAALVK
jgi:hypothetical protein